MKANDTCPRRAVTIPPKKECDLVAGLPGKASGGRRPCTGKLPQEHDPSEVVRVVGCQALQLLPHRHCARGLTRLRRAMNLLLQHADVPRDGGGLLVAAEESLAQRVPIFARCIGLTGEPGGGM